MRGMHVRTHKADDAAVVIMVGVEEQKLQQAIGSALWRRNVLYDCWQNGIQTLP